MGINEMKQVKLKNVKKGDFVRRKSDSKTTFIRADYEPSIKKFRLDDWDFVGRDIFLNGETLVFIDFEF